MCLGSIRPGSPARSVATFPSLPLCFPLSLAGGRLEEKNSTNGGIREISEVLDDANVGIQGNSTDLICGGDEYVC